MSTRSRIPVGRTKIPNFTVLENRLQNAINKAVRSKPVVVSKPKPAPRKSSAGFDLNSIFSDISGTFARGLNNPLVLCTIVLAFGLIVTHDHTKKTGFIYDSLKNNTDVISKWVVSNGLKFTGLCIFVPSVLDSPKSYQSLLALLSFFWVMIIPESKPAEYFLQSLALHTYFKLNNQKSKLVVLFVVGIAYMLGYFKLSA